MIWGMDVWTGLMPQLTASASGGLHGPPAPQVTLTIGTRRRRYHQLRSFSGPLSTGLSHPARQHSSLQTRLTADHAESLRGLFETPFAVAASTNAGPALGTAPGGRVVLGVVVERPVALGTGL
jgi:hypothetical protein